MVIMEAITSGALERLDEKSTSYSAGHENLDNTRDSRPNNSEENSCPDSNFFLKIIQDICKAENSSKMVTEHAVFYLKRLSGPGQNFDQGLLKLLSYVCLDISLKFIEEREISYKKIKNQFKGISRSAFNKTEALVLEQLKWNLRYSAPI